MEKTTFHAWVEKKEKARKYAEAYTNYAVSFVLLQLLDVLLANGFRLKFTPFACIEFAILFIIGIFLWSWYAGLVWYCRYQNREVRYDLIRKKYFTRPELRKYSNFGISWKSIMTLMMHSEMTERGDNNAFWGWGDDGLLHLDIPDQEVEEEATFSLIKKPWTCTERKSVGLSVICRENNCDRVSFSDMKFSECMQRNQIHYDNQIYVYPIYLDSNGNFIRLPYENGCLTEGFLLRKSMLDSGNVLNERLFETCMNRLQERLNITKTAGTYEHAGIIALFQDTDGEEKTDGCVPTGLLVQLQLDEKMSQKVMGLQSCGAWTSLDEMIEILLSDKYNALSQYALLMFIYSKKNRYEFVEKFIHCFKARKLTNIFWSAWETEEKEDAKRAYPVFAPGKKYTYGKQEILRLIRKGLYRFSEFIVRDPFSKILVLLVFILENVIEPFATDSGSETAETLVLLNNFRNGSWVTTLGMVGVVLALWLLFYWICSTDTVKRFLNPIEQLIGKEEKLLNIGQNKNLFWSQNLIQGWDSDGVSVALARGSYTQISELEKYDTEELKNERNDGIKYRMIGYTEQDEGIQLLVDRCRYTQTMRVQNMIRKKNEDALATELYQRFYCGILNLKERETSIKLDDIPPNSLCMHATVLTKDDYVLVTRRSPELSYYPNAFDSSAEEQLNVVDFEKEGIRVTNWVERFLQEELGVTCKNSESSSVGQVKVMSIFLEEDALNMALAVKVRLNVTAKQLLAILDSWPRKDYEFQYQMVTWNQLREHFREHYREYHPTAVNRLFFVACSEMRFAFAKEILELGRSKECRET